MDDKSEFEAELVRIACSITDLLLAKNHDYGDAWRKHGITGVLVRISDKALRLENISGKETLVITENAEDTLMDIAGYAMLGLMKIREDKRSLTEEQND